MKKCIVGISCLSLLLGGIGGFCLLKDNSTFAMEEIVENGYEGTIAENRNEELNIEESIVKETDKEVIDKEYVANHMLNAIDYYDTAEGNFITNMHDGTNARVDFIVTKDYKYEKTESEIISQEIICDSEMLNCYYHNANFKRSYIMGESNDDALGKLKFSDRMSVNAEGQKVYNYRSNVMPVASKCLFSQELSFGLFGDSSLWTIEDEIEYLGYPVIVVKGITEKEYGNKLGIQSFMLYIEKSTGILMKFEGYDASGNITKYTEMQDISIDKEITYNFEEMKEKLDNQCKDYATK